MRTTTTALALTAVAAATLGMTATPAAAACSDNVLNVCSGETTVALVVDAGTIAIAVAPAATNLTSVLSGTDNVQTVSLGLTTVTDTRLTSTGWSVSATSSDLTNGGSSIAASATSFYVPAAATSVLGGHTISRLATTAGDAVASGAVLVTDTGDGVNTAEFTPYMKVVIPSGTSALTYAGTVTQSVA
ncbi:MAG: hypothetical protein Q8R60_11425 [Mycobacteriales bacterium]|nr:hypothetical protein [Mycobacteriales bacterium]